MNESDFPAHGSVRDKVNFWLRYAVLAPSAHNTQPWSVKLVDDVLEVYRDPAHTLTVGDPTLRETQLGIGAFIENFIIAVNHWQHAVELSDIPPVNDNLCRVKLTITDSTNPQGPDLLPAITNRHTNRGPYQPTLPDSVLIDQIKDQKESSAKVFVVEETGAKSRIGDLVAKGTIIALSMRPMKEELASLVSFQHEQRSEGMFVESMSEQPDHDPSESASQWLKDKLEPKAQAQLDQDYFAQSPALVVIGTEEDGPEAWLAAGRLMERVLLMAAEHDLTHAIAAAPIEIPTLAPLLRKEIEPNYRPQVLIRIGRPIKPEFTYISGRRPITV